MKTGTGMQDNMSRRIFLKINRFVLHSFKIVLAFFALPVLRFHNALLSSNFAIYSLKKGASSGETVWSESAPKPRSTTGSLERRGRSGIELPMRLSASQCHNASPFQTVCYRVFQYNPYPEIVILSPLYPGVDPPTLVKTSLGIPTLVGIIGVAPNVPVRK